MTEVAQIRGKKYKRVKNDLPSCDRCVFYRRGYCSGFTYELYKLEEEDNVDCIRDSFIYVELE